MRGKSDRKFQIFTHIVLCLESLLVLIPFVLLLSASFSNAEDITLYGYSLIPKNFSLDAYEYIWNEKLQIFRAYFVTIMVTAIGTTIGLFLTLLYAYVLSKPAFPGKTFFSLYLFFTMLFNGGLVPTYILYTRYIHIQNTLAALIIPTLLLNAFNVILVRSYIQNNIPVALTEAAIIDGAGEYKIFGVIILPLAKPIIVTVGLFIGIAYWNDWTNGLYYVADNNLYSIQQLLNNMLRNIQYLSQNPTSRMIVNTGNIPQATVRMAIAVVGILPIIVIYPFVQKYFIKGIALGAVKG